MVHNQHLTNILTNSTSYYPNEVERENNKKQAGAELCQAQFKLGQAKPASPF